MREMSSESVDVIYLDPPFNSKRNYNLMYKTMTNQPVPEQVEAFCDTWTLDAEKEDLLRSMPVKMLEYGVSGEFAEFWRIWINALRHTQPRLLAYIVYMTIRLLEMRRVLKSSGTLYLHCDPTASHYIKVIMDGIFGHNHFRNEIIWCYRGGGILKRILVENMMSFCDIQKQINTNLISMM
jgi:adenine specific DNA methylase Mod